MSDKLNLRDLVDGLTLLGDFLTRFDVFADDVRELDAEGAPQAPQPLRQLDSSGRSYVFEHRCETFELIVYDNGVARVSRAETPRAATNGAVHDAVVDDAIRVARLKKGAGWPQGLILGMGAGRPFGAVGQVPRPRPILPMRFDSSTRTWSAYDGGLVPWIKSEFDRTG